MVVHDLVAVTLAVVAMGMLFQLIKFGAVLVHILRMPCWPQCLSPEGGHQPLSADQRAALEELEALGFREIHQATYQEGPLRYLSVLLRHGTQSTFAKVRFRGGAYAGYPVEFYSLSTDGPMICTGNRLSWAYLSSAPSIRWEDAFADSLAGHWHAHLARLAGLAVVELSDEEARERIDAGAEGCFSHWMKERMIVESDGRWHPSLRWALALTFTLLRSQRKLKAPYISVLTQGEHQSAFFTLCYLEIEEMLAARPPRRKLKAWLLALTVMVSLIAWGVAYGPSLAVVVVVILLVHEGGHALAMRAFGYRDMNMFFVPMVGAVVAGVIAKELSAWKQAVVLLAGPIPGLVIGLGLLGFGPQGASIDWQTIGGIAVGVNLFNLLPVGPLDGGRLLELSLFSRWPTARMVVSGLSVLAFVGLAKWTDDTVVPLMLALLMAFGTIASWRSIALERVWSDEGERSERIRRLFEAAQRTLKAQTFLRHYPLVKGVVTRRQICRPRLWESALVLMLLVGLWSGVGFVAYESGIIGGVRAQISETRTPAQIEFDDAAYDYDDDSSPAALENLLTLSQKLDPDDPRRIDMVVRQAWQLPEPQRQAQFDSVLMQERDGHEYSRNDVASDLLGHAVAVTARLGAEDRIRALQQAVDHVMTVAPRFYSATLNARLRIAERVDQGGEPDRAWALLEDLRQTAGRDEGCQCEVRDIVAAQAWFQLSHQRPEQALAVLESSPYASHLGQRSECLTRDHAWALLAAGRISEGVEQMRRAAYTEPRQPSFKDRLFSGAVQSPHLVEVMDMAYALVQKGKADEARQLIANRPRTCFRADKEAEKLWSKPWQQGRELALRDISLMLCPPTESRRMTH